MKQLYLLFLSFFLLHCVPAQTVLKQQILAGGSSDDEVTAGIIRTKEGGFMAGGYSYSLPGTYKKAPNYGSGDFWIIKYDKSGKKQFDRTFGGNDYDVMYSLVQTPDGGYTLAGSSVSDTSGTKTAHSLGGRDMWLVRTDSLGRQLWDKTYGGTGEDYIYNMAQTKDGGYILCGASSSGISGNKTENSFGKDDYWVLKVDASGNIQWQKTFGGDKVDGATNVVQTSDGGYFIAGHSNSGISGNKTSATHGGEDIWIIKTDSLGNKLWDKNIGGGGYDEMATMQSTADGGFLLGAYSGSGISGDKIEGTKGSTDYWLVKVDGAGNILWQKDIGSNGNEILTGLKQTLDGGYILTGYTNGTISGDKTEDSRGFDDNWVVKLAADRTVQWDKTIGGDEEDGGGNNNIVQLSSSLYLLASASGSPANYDKTVPNLGSFDIWLTGIQYNPLAITDKAVSTSLSALPASPFTVAPNPAKDVIHVGITGKAIVTLTNAEGKRLLTSVVTGQGDISVSGFSAGTYYLKNTVTNEVKKIMIVK